MPTDKEIEAATKDVIEMRRGGCIVSSSKAIVRVALEAAEKVRAEAPSKREEKLQEATKSLIDVFDQDFEMYPTAMQQDVLKKIAVVKQALQQED